MELIAIIILVSLGLIIFAFTYSAKQRTRKQKQLFARQLEEIAHTAQLKWAQQHVGLHRAMAWDPAKKMLAFIDGTIPDSKALVVNMQEVSSCQLHYGTTPANDVRSAPRAQNITGIELQLFFKDPEKIPIALPFFSEILDGNFEKTTQSQKAEHWLALIS